MCGSETVWDIMQIIFSAFGGGLSVFFYKSGIQSDCKEDKQRMIAICCLIALIAGFGSGAASLICSYKDVFVIFVVILMSGVFAGLINYFLAMSKIEIAKSTADKALASYNEAQYMVVKSGDHNSQKTLIEDVENAKKQFDTASLEHKRLESAKQSMSYSLVLGVGAALLVPLFLNILASDLLKQISTEAGKIQILILIGFCLAAAISAEQFISSVSSKATKQSAS
jgi:hypothetical protein